jgi:hypothetical protein
MASTVRHVGFHNAAISFPLLERRSIAVNTANLQIAVGNEQTGASTGVALPLLAIRYYTTSAQYVTGDFVIYSGQIYKAITTITPGAFNPAQWVGMTDGGQFLLRDGTREMFGNLEIEKPGASLVLNAIGASQADVWFRRDGLTRWLIRSKETPEVDFIIARFDDGGFVIDVPLTISRSTGRLSVLTNPTLPLELAPKQYVDNLVATLVTDTSGFVHKAGDTMTGGLIVPVLTIRNGSFADLNYQAGGPTRWLARGADAGGSNYELHHYDNAGNYLGAALVLDNSNGNAFFQRDVVAAGVLKATPGMQFGSAAPTGVYGDGTNVAIRTYGNNSIYFQGANGTNSYGYINYDGLHIDGNIDARYLTATWGDGLRNSVPAGNYARTQYTVAGARQWTTGVFPDGRYVIQDESAGLWRFIINLDGSCEFNGPLRVNGSVTATSFSGPGIGGGPLTGNVEGAQYIDFAFPGDTWDYSARIIVTTPSPGSAGHSKATFYTDELTITGNLKVNGSIDAVSGTGIAGYTGYKCRPGVTGGNPAFFPGGFTPGAFNVVWPYFGPVPGGTAQLWIDDFQAGVIAPMSVTVAEVRKEVDPLIDALTQRLEAALERIAALEARLA